MKFRTDLQKHSSLHHHFRCRHHVDGLLSHVNPTNNSEKAILAFVGVLILLETCIYSHNESKKSKKTHSYLFFCSSTLTALLLQSSP